MDVVEQRNMVDGLLRGMLKQRLQKSDKNFADDVITYFTVSNCPVVWNKHYRVENSKK